MTKESGINKIKKTIEFVNKNKDAFMIFIFIVLIIIYFYQGGNIKNLLEYIIK